MQKLSSCIPVTIASKKKVSALMVKTKILKIGEKYIKLLEWGCDRINRIMNELITTLIY